MVLCICCGRLHQGDAVADMACHRTETVVQPVQCAVARTSAACSACWRHLMQRQYAVSAAPAQSVSVVPEVVGYY